MNRHLEWRSESGACEAATGDQIGLGHGDDRREEMNLRSDLRCKLGNRKRDLCARGYNYELAGEESWNDLGLDD